jgi:hypothetical protein
MEARKNNELPWEWFQEKYEHLKPSIVASEYSDLDKWIAS